MVINAVRIGATVNVGNYQSIKIEMEAQIDSGDNHEEAVEHLIETINLQIKALTENRFSFDSVCKPVVSTKPGR